MNKIYRLVWSSTQKAWVVAGEFAGARGKGTSSLRIAKRVGGLSGFVAAALMAFPADAWVAGTGTSSATLDNNITSNTSINGGAATASGGATAIGPTATASAASATAIGPSSTASGIYSIAIGDSAKATIVNGIALGHGAKASGGNGAMAIGALSSASSDGAIAFGSNSVATNTNATAIGRSSVANGYSSVAIGDTATAVPDHTTAIGGGSSVTALSGTSIGWYANTAGIQSQALGYYANAQGGNATAVGPNASSVGDYSLALGSTAIATGNSSIAMGQGAQATNTSPLDSADSAIAIGNGANVNSTNAIALGNKALVGFLDTGSIAIGSSSTAHGVNSIAMGDHSSTISDDALAIGANSKTYNQSVAIGSGAKAGTVITTGAVAVGYNAVASGLSTSSIGRNSQATANYGVALGAGTIADRTGMNGAKELFSKTAVASTQGAVSVGAAGAERQITNVAGGTQATDAVNVRQLQAVSDSSVHYDNNPDGTINYTNVTLGGTTYNSTTHTGGTKITNVADGTDPSDAVNFSQLTNTNNNINNIYATGTKYFHANSTGTDSSATGTDAVAIGMGAVADVARSVALGDGAKTKAAVATTGANIAGTDYAFAGIAPAGTVSIGDKGAERTLTNLAAGSLSATSTDGINGSQLFATNSAINNLDDHAVKYDTNVDGTVNYNNVTLGGDTYNNTTHTGGTKIANVADGSAPSDAVNFSQLTNTNNNINNIYATGTKYFHANSTGTDSSATGTDAVAIGMGAVADVARSVALGDGAKTKAAVATTGANIAGTDYAFAGIAPAGTVSIGDKGAERTLTNLAAGSLSATSTDGINGSQLFATNSAINNLDDHAVKYDTNVDGTVNYNNVTLGGDTYNNTTHTGGTKITNVADGSDPSDAVNFSQLTNTNNTINNIYATGTKYFHANSTGTDSSATGTDAVAIGMGAVADIAHSVALGDGASTMAAVGTAGAKILGVDYTFAGTAPVGTVSIGSKGAERTLTNLAAGSLSATSTDGVNGSQLFATNTALSTITGDVTNLDAGSVKYEKFVDGTVNYNSITLGGDTYDNSTHTGGTKITNVADGTDPSDAVNFSQLTETNNNVTNLGDQVDNIYNTGTKYFHANSTSTDSSATGTDAVAIGMGAVADVARSVALGDGSKTQAAEGTSGTTLLGVDYAFAGTSPVGTVSIGDAGAERTLTNMAAGRLSADSTDGVNGSQLFATNTALNSVTSSVTNLDAGTVHYDKYVDGTVNYNSVTMGGDTYNSTTHTGGTKITNIADGSDPSDAVNFSQLTETNNNIDNIYNTGTKYFHANSTGTDSSATGIDAVAIGMGAVADVARSVALGDGAKTELAVATTGTTIRSTDYAFAGAAPVGTVSIGATGDERTLTNMAAGRLSADSTDGVNGSQLFASNQAIDSLDISFNDLDNHAVKYDTNIDGNVNYNSVTLGGDTYDNSTHTGGTKITNVADGTDPSDAVNFSQLTNTNNNINNIYATGTKYFHANSTGTDSSATGTDAVAIGMGAVADVARSVALGDGATTQAVVATTGTTLLGTDYAFAGSAPIGTVSIGSAGAERTLTNMAAGRLSADSTDGVNGSQLFATNQALNNLDISFTDLDNHAVKYDTNVDGTVNYNSVTMGGDTYNSTTHTGGTQITNVADGSAPSDAVNFSQLTETNNSINNVYSNGTKYFHANSTGADSSATGADAVAIGQSATASAMSSIAIGNGAEASTDNSVALGNGAKTQAAVGTSGITIQGQNYAFAGSAPVGTVSVGDAGAERTITNVAAGQITESSTDAVNGSQLYAVADAVNNISGDITNLDNRSVKYDINNDGTTNYNKITLAGGPTTITNVAAGTQDSDAVNYAQLEVVSTQVANISNGTDGMFQVNNTSNLPKPKPTGKDSTAGGAGAVASGDNSVALGSNSGATASNSVALGSNSVADRDNTVSMGSAGHERQISNVAAGTSGTDAVNVNQLKSGIADANQYTDNKFGDLKNLVDGNKDKLSAGIAGAMAMASLPQPYAPGASMVSMGGGTYQNQSAVALGVSAISDNGKWVTKMSGTTNSQGDLGAAVGVGYQW